MTIEPLELLAAIAKRVNESDPLSVASRHAEIVRGGFGSKSIPDGSRSSEPPLPISQPVIERDSDGNPVRWGTIGPADSADREANRHARSYVRHLERALNEMDAAAEDASWFLVAVQALSHGIPGCMSCARAKVFSERFRGDFCQWCYGIVTDKELNPTRKLPPFEVLERHHAGLRISRSELERALLAKKSA